MMFIAFREDKFIAAGDLPSVARAAKEKLRRQSDHAIFVFDGNTGARVEIDFRASMAEILARLPIAVEAAPVPSARGPGRPKLGVVSREVTLLPQHWAWLARQPGGASVALRKLVEAARLEGGDTNRVRHAQQATCRFISVMADKKPHSEEAIRALFAGDAPRFKKLIAEWPRDVRDHVLRFAEGAFHHEGPPSAG